MKRIFIIELNSFQDFNNEEIKSSLDEGFGSNYAVEVITELPAFE